MSFDKVFNSLNIKMEAPDLTDHLSEDIITRFETGDELGIISNNGIFSQDDLLIGGDTEEEEPDDIIILHMDIREPLSTLRFLLEQKIGVNLKKYNFCLQDAQMLESHKNLVDQCVKGEGLVQINVQIQTIGERINIVDVLKPTEAALEAAASIPPKQPEPEPIKKVNEVETPTTFNENTNSNAVSMEDESDRDERNLHWVLDSKFKKDQARLKIPDEPSEWTNAEVKHWLQWAVRQFNLTQIKLNDWNISGKELCDLTQEGFHVKVPNDPGNVFWTHLELLRKHKYVAIIQKFTDEDDDASQDSPTILKKSPKAIKRSLTGVIKQGSMAQWESSGNRTGNNGQIQLWQFLLDILTDKEHTSIIQWLGPDGEFKLMDPERVAQLWGERKNKPTMNYEKLSRALRYYYDGDMISKVHGKRFVYKFVCDLKQLIGYDAQELSDLINQSRPVFPSFDLYID